MLISYYMLKTIISGFIISVVFIIIPLGNSFSQSSTNQSSSDEVIIVAAETPEAKANLDRFDQLDFDAWNNRNWTLFQEIHSPDVLVVDFNGNVTKGIEQHLQWANKSI
jgi:hypothetical protein